MRQAGRNKLEHKLPQYSMHHVYMVMCSSIQRNSRDLVYKDKQRIYRFKFCQNRAGKSVKQFILNCHMEKVFSKQVKFIGGSGEAAK